MSARETPLQPLGKNSEKNSVGPSDRRNPASSRFCKCTWMLMTLDFGQGFSWALQRKALLSQVSALFLERLTRLSKSRIIPSVVSSKLKRWLRQSTRFIN